MASETRSHREEDDRVRILRLIDGSPSISQRELAQHLGLSVGKVNYLLKALAEKGAIKAQNFRRSDNKIAYAYALTPAGLVEKAILTRNFLKRKLAEYGALEDEIEDLKRELERDA